MKTPILQPAGGPSLALESPDIYHDLPFLLIACLLHAYLLSQNVGFHWSLPAPKPDQAMAVDIVQQAPNPALLAPMAPGTGKKDSAFHHGPGPIRTEKIKRGHPAMHKHKRLSAAAIAAIKARRLEHQRLMLERLQREQERQRQVAIQRAEVRRLREEQRRIAQERLAEQRRVAAERLAEQKRIEAERRAAVAKAQEEERQRILAEKRAALERERALEAERRRIHDEKVAALRQMQAAQKAAVERELASLPNPDEAIADAAEAPAAGPAAAAAVSGKAVGAAKGAGRLLDAPAGASLGAVADSGADLQAEDADSDGRGGKDDVNMKPSGGGPGQGDGGPVSWSLDGPIGSRRLLQRVVPPCPDWVSRRGLDLVVTLKFQVMGNGAIKEVILVKKTSGFPNLDQLAMETLRRWKFEAYHPKNGAKAPAIWGVVSFRFVAA